jgi:tetratricopeptide (TPR) repeat protein
VGYYYRSDYIEARRELEDILSAYPDHAPSHKYLEKIMAALEEKDRIKERQNDALLQKAQTAFEKKNYIAASKLYNKVLYSDPYNSEAKAGLDKVRRVVADVKQEETVKKNLDLIKATWKKASQLYRKGDLVRSKEEFKNILVLDPENLEAKKRVLEIDEQLTRIAAGQANELYSRGLELYRKGQYAESIKYFEAVTLAAPNRLDSLDMIKRAQQNMNDIDAKGKAEKLAVE